MIKVTIPSVPGNFCFADDGYCRASERERHRIVSFTPVLKHHPASSFATPTDQLFRRSVAFFHLSPTCHALQGRVRR